MRCAAVCALAGLAPVAPGIARASWPRPPVVLVVFDEFPTTSLLGAHRRIDAVRYPAFASLARDATWFRNATTVHDSTFATIPAILDGRRPLYDPHRAPPRRSLFSLLRRHGYRVRASAEAAGVCPARFCGRGQGTRYYLVRSRLARLDGFIGQIGPTAQPTVYFKHTLLPHVPWMYLPDGEQYVRNVHGPIRGLNSALLASGRGLVRLAYQRHLLQVGAVDHELGKLLERLKRTGLYDRAMIVVTADHGISFRLGELDRRILTHANVQDIAPVPLFVKLPHQRRGRVSRAYARNGDVLPTIADVLNIRVPWRLAGRSVFSAAVRARHAVRVAGRSLREPVVALGARAFQARWSRSIRYQHFLFGYGHKGPGLYGLGPFRGLLGRRIDDLRISPPGRARARLIGAPEFREVRLGSRFRPSLVAGRIEGGRPGARRGLAIAVNGRIAAVSRSFYLRGGRTESFAAMVPDADFEEGRNEVLVLGVTPHSRVLRLRLLGSA